ncbi:MAG: hypothetical protein WD572_02860 [Gammaproteobacteria bacterium]
MSFYDISRDLMGFVVRAIGMLLLLFGMWLSLEVLNEAWQLYNDPTRIERFAKAIEKGSNIDRSIAPLQISSAPAEPGNLSTYPDGRPKPASPAPAATAETLTNPEYRFRLSYFVGWIVALLLLLLLARIAIGIVRTGGELVLYDNQFKRFAKELVRETGRYHD